jgi:acetyl-CoA synthetase
MSFYNMAQDVDRHASKDKIAIRWRSAKGERRELTYAQLKEKSDCMAKGLVERGLKLGDRIMILLPRIPEAYISYLACLKAGLSIIPGSEMLRPHDIRYRVEHADIKAVIAHEDLVERVDEAVSDLDVVSHRFVHGERIENWEPLKEVTGNDDTSLPQTKLDDIAFISYTSGTTGGPKGVIHHHSWAIAHQAGTTKDWLGIEEEDVVWATAGPGWAKWIWSPFISTLGAGATAFVYLGGFEPETYLTLLQDEKINVLCCTPTEYRMMAKTDHLERFDLSHLRNAVSAGEPLNREVLDTFKKYFSVEVRDGYGQTENTLLVGTLIGMEVRAGSMGKPIPQNKVLLVDDDGNEVPVGKVGHIAVHRSSPALFKGYYRDEVRTNAAFIGDYYITGDLAKKDEDGYFWFEGRSDDIIISSGYTIGPFEVEDALVKHPSVKESAVVASPDPIRGAIVKAFVILKESATPSDELVKELQDHVKRVTAPYKYPREIEFVDSLPKTTSGKIRRVELRQLEQKRKSLKK